MSGERAAEQRDSPFERHPRLTLLVVLAALGATIDLTAGLLFIHPPSGFRVPHPYYHHDLRPNASGHPEWGYQGDLVVSTNSLGFRDRSVHDVPLRSQGRRMLLLGDSFAEGLGVDYDQTFAGRLGTALAPRGIEVLNASVSSYSPKLDYLKARYLLEEVGLKIDDLVLFIDISDTQDEIIYRDFEPAFDAGFWPRLRFRMRELLWRRSYLYHTAAQLAERARGESTYINYEGGLFRFLSPEARAVLTDPQFAQHREMWTMEPQIYRAWGQRGLELGASNVDKLRALCLAHHVTLTVVVYPWSGQILHGDVDSIQERFWRAFCQAHGVPFIDLFLAFMPAHGQTPAEVVGKYYIPGNGHWSAEGHRLVAEQVLAQLPTLK
jgi:hypothetical protein